MAQATTSKRTDPRARTREDFDVAVSSGRGDFVDDPTRHSRETQFFESKPNYLGYSILTVAIGMTIVAGYLYFKNPSVELNPDSVNNTQRIATLTNDLQSARDSIKKLEQLSTTTKDNMQRLCTSLIESQKSYKSIQRNCTFNQNSGNSLCIKINALDLSFIDKSCPPPVQN